MTIGERIRMLRNEQGLTLEQVADRIGIGKGTASKYESGIIKEIPNEKVHKLANLFGVSRPFLMGWTEEREINPSVNLDMVAEKLRMQMAEPTRENEKMWRSVGLKTVDCTTAATQAYRALVKFDISRSPVYPHKVLQQSQLATMISFADVRELGDIMKSPKLKVFRYSDMVMSAISKTHSGKEHYIFAVNREAPMGKIRLMLALELGHIYLGHARVATGTMHMDDEAECFAIHFEFPRPLIKLLMEREFVFTEKSFSRIFGDCEWCIDSILSANPVNVSPELNRMVKEQFVQHVDLLEEAGVLAIPPNPDEEVLDLSRYMKGYEE